MGKKYGTFIVDPIVSPSETKVGNKNPASLFTLGSG